MSIKFSKSNDYRDRENSKFTPDVNDDVAIRTVSDGRSSSSRFSDIANAFNPLAMPLLTWTRIIEQPDEDDPNYPQGIYFVNDSFIQFYFKLTSNNPYDMEIVENNILLLSDNVALELDTIDGVVVFSINDIFLELE